MHKFIEQMEPQNYLQIRNVANQIAGRKPRNNLYNYKLPRHRQHRTRQSPFKDFADASQSQMIQFLKSDSMQRHEGGGLFGALEDIADTMHKEVRKLPGVKEIEPLKNTLMDMAGTADVNVDVAADDLLHRVGLRHHRKYKDAEIDDNLRAHALLQKDAYLKLNDRKGTDRFEYINRYSTDKYATYRDLQNQGKVVVAFRGTDPKQAIHNNDFIEDVNIAAGNVNAISEYDDYKNHVTKMLDEFGDGNVSLSGYSLGGAKAVALTREKSLRSRLGTTMAIAPGMTATDKQLAAKAHDTKIQYYYHHNDNVANALLTHGGSNHHVFYNQYDPIKSHMVLSEFSR